MESKENSESTKVSRECMHDLQIHIYVLYIHCIAYGQSTHLRDWEVEEPLSLVAESCLLLALFQVLHQPPDFIGNLTSFVKVCTA